MISGVKGLWNYVIENGIAKYSEYLEIGYWILFFSIVSSLYVVLTDVLKMTFEKIDGYMIYDEKEPYILDSHLIDIFLSYTAHKKTQIN